MKSTILSGLGRWVAVAIAVALVSLGFSSGVAQAAGVGNIDPSKKGSLTIHKYAGNEGNAGDGTEISNPSSLGTPLDGVKFSITPVTAKGTTTIDLTKAEGWDAIKGISANDVITGDYTKGAATEVTTDANGNAKQSNMSLGLYLVQETSAGSNNIVSKVAPFLVTLPLPQSGGNWLYDVHTYPKNKLNETTPTKTVSDPVKPVLGQNVTWTINAPVPALNKSDSYTSFVITDSLDSRLGYVSATITNENFSASDYTVGQSGQTVTITLTKSGLAKLAAGTPIVATITTTVNSLGDNGIISNKALVNTNGSTRESNTPTTNWGPLQILKYATGDESKVLAGAEFAVFSDSAAQTQVGTITTGDDGKGSISLWVGNNDAKSKKYYVKETKAPAGYVLDDSVKEVTVQANGTTSPVVVKVANPQQGHPNLPLTGASGRILLTIAGAGLLLVAVGAGVITATRKRRGAQG